MSVGIHITPPNRHDHFMNKLSIFGNGDAHA